ncbi:MAG: hypothetical protein PHX60_15555 [Giesbergeria sp.]|uniref:hypothetical protein n=1 Tax=Giesbergeria sp. TaxID=2818473 RepID=UPI002606F5C0|nr:hypothetical protein [Giesbergeria sp.]MDD2611069.1 hypothetical protein [Giesbergeria sp.]
MNHTSRPSFERYIGIDYSGAQTPISSLKGLREFMATAESDALEVLPPPSPRKYWTRQGVAHWLLQTLSDATPTIVGIDHGFSFPLRYFEYHQIQPDWDIFLRDFQQHWPTDGEYVYVDFVRDGFVGNGAQRIGSPKWRRITEQRCRAKSVFQFDVQGSVAKSTRSGLPWLLFLREKLGQQLHFWPFDGFCPPSGRSVVAEAYPSLYKHRFPSSSSMTGDQQDAWAIACWLKQADSSGELQAVMLPQLDPSMQLMAKTEGWILGVA